MRNSSSPRRSPARTAAHRNNRALKTLMGIIAAHRGGVRWASRARQTVARRGTRAGRSPPRNNRVMVAYMKGASGANRYSHASNRRGGWWN